jgi:uncharacterized protein involved in response to NO
VSTPSLARSRHTQPPERGQAPFALAAPLLGTALVVGVVGGFALATVLTVSQVLRVPGGLWWMAMAQAHGHLQLYGWAGLFVLGVLLHFLPRLRGAPLAAAGAVRWLLASLVVGLALRAVGQVWLTWTGAGVAGAALVASGLLEGVALAGFAAVLLATLLRGPALATRPALRGVLPLLVLALAALTLAAAVNLVNTLATARGGSGIVPGAGDAFDVTLGLYGFLVPVALAMSAQALPMYAGLQAFPRAALWPLAGVYAGGLLTLCAGACGVGGSASARVGALGMGLLGGALLTCVAVFITMMRARGTLPAKVERLAPSPNRAVASYRAHIAAHKAAYGPFVQLVASAYLWAALAGLLLGVDGIAGALAGQMPVAVDAIRHCIAVGFIALLICGIAPRMVPGFSSGHIRSPRLVTATLWLGNGAAVLRVGSLLAQPLLVSLGAGGTTIDAAAFGISGPVGLALAACLAVNLWPAIWHGARASRRTHAG